MQPVLSRSEVLTLESQTVYSKMPHGESRVDPIRLNEPAVFSSTNAISFRLYPDNRPRNLEIAPLQKGLVMIFRGKELIEEGAGFGLPIAKYEDNTFFSSTAYLYSERQSDGSVILRKVFSLDAVSKKQVRGASVNDAFYTVLHKNFERAYLKRESLRSIFDWTMWLRKMLGVTTQFVRVKQRGLVAITYHCFPGIVEVRVNLSALDKTGAQEILILNEQGASAFRMYSDTNGVVLYDRQIGAWAKVTAKQAAFSDKQRQVSFVLEQKPNASLIRGREAIKDRFSWAGMTYALSPIVSHFEYTIRLEEKLSSILM